MYIYKPMKPEVWIQGTGSVGMYEHVAKCAAICYNSTPKTWRARLLRLYRALLPR